MNATLKTQIRKAACASGTPYPIVAIPETNAAPKLTGESWHYETRGGTRISHPSAYSKSGWSNMVYCHSTIRIEVGANWQPAAA
jgi:hypothetical protein